MKTIAEQQEEYRARLASGMWPDKAAEERLRMLAEIERLQALVDRMLWSMQKKAEMDLLPRAAEVEPGASQRCDYVGMYDAKCGLDLGHTGGHWLFGPHRGAVSKSDEDRDPTPEHLMKQGYRSGKIGDKSCS